MANFNDETAEARLVLAKHNRAHAQPPDSARALLRFSNGPRRVLDGPFTEAKELVLASSAAGAWPSLSPAGRFAPVHGLRMYYELHGSGRPLVVLHGGLMTIESSFGQVLPLLGRTRQVIAVEQQAHGRTADIDRQLSIEQMADDTVELLRQRDVRQADFLGFSTGGSVALQIAVRHPGLVRKLAIVGAMCRSEGFRPGFLPMFSLLDPADASMAQARQEFRRVAPKPEQWSTAWSKFGQALGRYRGLSGEHLKSIRAHTLLVAGDADEAIFPEHVAEMSQFMPHAQLHMLAGRGHLATMGGAAPLIPAFLDAPCPESRVGRRSRLAVPAAHEP